MMHNLKALCSKVLTNLTVLDRTLLFIGFALVLFFSSFHLFESPETWMDEGLIIQTAKGMLETGKASLPVAPRVYEPLGYITTGFPLTLPLAGAFAVFGVSLEVARVVMLVFLLGLYIALFFYTRKAIGGVAFWFGFFLLVFFGPLYGNGRNVLGEIPGLLFMVCALLPLISQEVLTKKRALWVGMWTGLAVVTKPIFILFIPALAISMFLRRRELKLNNVFFFGVLGGVPPLLIWMVTQFDHISFSSLLAVYANPHNIDIGNAILTNLKRLTTEIQPFYFIATLGVWGLSYGVRRVRHEAVSLTEEVLLIFSVLICLAYLRTTGYYRYFFPAQVFTLLYLPQSLLYLVKNRTKFFPNIVYVFLCGLLLFQAYQTTFRSWVAVHYDSIRTDALHHYFTTLPVGEEIFIYQAPEIVPFAMKNPLYQYVEITSSIRVGEKYTSRILSGTAGRVITKIDFFRIHEKDIFSRYTRTEEIDSYVILTAKDN